MMAPQYLEPTFGQEEVDFDAVFSKLLGHVEAHGAVFVVDLPLGLIVQYGVGVVDLLEALGCLWVVWVLVRMISQCKFSA